MNDIEENRYVDGLFQISDEGSTDFYPWGGFGRGFVTTGQRQRDELRRIVRLFFQLATTGWLLFAYATTGSEFWLFGAGLLLLVLHVWYHRATRTILADASAASGSFPWRRVLRKIARSMSAGTLWTFAFVCLAMILFGAFYFLDRGEFRLQGLAIALIFGALAICAGYLIAVRGRD